MSVGICKCRRGFTNASIVFRKCLNFYSSPLFLNFDTKRHPILQIITGLKGDKPSAFHKDHKDLLCAASGVQRGEVPTCAHCACAKTWERSRAYRVYFAGENFRKWLALAYFANNFFADCLYVSHTPNERQRVRRAYAKYTRIIFSRIGTYLRNSRKFYPSK